LAHLLRPSWQNSQMRGSIRVGSPRSTSAAKRGPTDPGRASQASAITSSMNLCARSMPLAQAITAFHGRWMDRGTSAAVLRVGRERPRYASWRPKSRACSSPVAQLDPWDPSAIPGHRVSRVPGQVACAFLGVGAPRASRRVRPGNDIGDAQPGAGTMTAMRSKAMALAVS